MSLIDKMTLCSVAPCTVEVSPAGRIFAGVHEVLDADVDRVVIAGTGSREPLGILNTSGIRAVYVPDRWGELDDIVYNSRAAGDLVIATPTLSDVLSVPDVQYVEACTGEDDGERVILVDPRTCFVGRDGSLMVFSAAGSNALVFGGWN